MSILIKGQSLPKDGDHYLIQINSDGTIYDAVGKRLAAVAGVVAELPAAETLCAYENPWISVTERLPEAGERVLCYCRANIYEVMKMRTDGDWVYDTNHVYMHSFVTHWMPLPTPPKENEE